MAADPLRQSSVAATPARASRTTGPRANRSDRAPRRGQRHIVVLGPAATHAREARGDGQGVDGLACPCHLRRKLTICRPAASTTCLTAASVRLLARSGVIATSGLRRLTTPRRVGSSVWDGMHRCRVARQCRMAGSQAARRGIAPLPGLGNGRDGSSRSATSCGQKSARLQLQQHIAHRARRPFATARRLNALGGQFCRHLAERQAASP